MVLTGGSQNMYSTVGPSGLFVLPLPLLAQREYRDHYDFKGYLSSLVPTGLKVPVSQYVLPSLKGLSPESNSMSI